MRRILDQSDIATPCGCVESFFDNADWLDWKPRLYKRQVGVVGDADRQRRLSPRHRFCQLAEIASDQHILPRQLGKILLSFNLPQKRPGGFSRARRARVEYGDFSLPFGIQ